MQAATNATDAHLEAFDAAFHSGELTAAQLHHLDAVYDRPTAHPQLHDAAASEFDRIMSRVVRERYAAIGLTERDLRDFLEASLDVDDALERGVAPALSPERYKHYKRVKRLLMEGPELTEEQQDWLAHHVLTDVLQMPWPTPTMRRLQQRFGTMLKRQPRRNMTTYDQGWMTEAIFPFQSKEEVDSHRTGTPSTNAPGSYWEDELDEDGNIQRSGMRTRGTVDMRDWGMLAAAALYGQVSTPAADAPEGGADVADGASPPAAAAAEGQLGLFDALEEMHGEESAAAAAERLEPAAADVLAEVLREEQAASIVRRHGFDAADVPAFLEAAGMTRAEFDALVEDEVQQQVQLFGTASLDGRSPDDVLEDFVPAKRNVDFFEEAPYNLREMLEKRDDGPFGDKHIFPEFLDDPTVMHQPAAERRVMATYVDDFLHEDVVPDIFKWTENVMMHTGSNSHHPGNRRVQMRVHVYDLQARYSLSPEAVAHVIQVAGKRYNPRTGVLKMSCDVHRAREENKRQLLHWTIKLVEQAHVRHPNAAWETLRQQQVQYMESVVGK